MKDLVQRCSDKEEGAWEELVDEFSDMVYSIIVGYYRLSLADADDLFQGIFIEIHKDIGSIRDPAKLKSWIKVITRNKVLNFLKRRWWESARFKVDERFEELCPGSFDAIEDMDMEKKTIFVREALSNLGDVRCRNIIECRYFDELSHEDISLSLKIPKGSIAPTLKRNYEKLRKYFSKLGIQE